VWVFSECCHEATVRGEGKGVDMVRGDLRGIAFRCGHEGLVDAKTLCVRDGSSNPRAVSETPLPCRHTTYLHRGEGVDRLGSREANP